LITICARAGSKGLKGKNIRSLLGIPLIAHSIKQAREWGKAKKIVVSTDSPEIAAIARRYGAAVPFLRPKALAGDTSAKLPAIRHAFKTCEELYGIKYDFVVDLDPTAPLRTKKDLDNCYKMFVSKRPKSLFSVVRSRKNPYFNMVEKQPGGWVKLCKKLPNGAVRRQDAPRVYDLNASIYFLSRKLLLAEDQKSVITDRSLIYVMEDYAAFDIDCERDFVFVEYLAKKGFVKI
jgi:CMP-N-acetylneuraminic acid synthetase